MRGHNPAWQGLPRRKCDNCGKSYKPVQPLRPGMRGFCTGNCRKEYHRHGGAYRKLRGEMLKVVNRYMKELQAEQALMFRRFETYVAGAIDLHEAGHHTRAYIKKMDAPAGTFK